MSTSELGILIVVIALGVGVSAIVLIAVVAVRRRGRAFAEFVRARGWALQAPSPPWIDAVAEGTVGTHALRVGTARLETSGESYLRVHTRHRAPAPAGLWLHGQPFRTNTSTASRGPYDGRYDDPSTSSLFGSVPELTLGDESLDRAFVIRADDPVATKQFLLREPLRSALLAAAATGAHVRLRGGAVELDAEPTSLGDAATYDRLVVAVAAIADAIDEG